jgi:hypothetical protein
LPVANGGTGQTSYTDGQLLIGNSTGNTLTKATLTAGTNVTITNAAGAITIAASGGSGGTPAGSNTQIQYNNAGAFGASPSFYFDGTNTVLDGSTRTFVFGSGAKIQMQSPPASANWIFETSGLNLTVSSAQSGQFNIYNGSAATTLGVGGATPSTSGSGITFPATQSGSSNVNTLDDYEEGTWTPGFRDYTYDVNSSFTYTSRSGTYTKIGRVVTCYFTATIATVTAGNGQAFGLDGLPFNPSSSLPFVGTLATSGVDWPANTLTTAITYLSSVNAAIFTATGDNVGTIRCTSGGTAAGDVIEGSLVYYVA